jgi:hypothetical protein
MYYNNNFQRKIEKLNQNIVMIKIKIFSTKMDLDK